MSNNNNQVRDDSSEPTIDRRRFLAGTAGTAAIGLLAGCSGGGGGSGDGSSGSGGSSGDGDGGSSSGGGTTTSSTSSDPITIGASAALTGSYSVEGQALAKGYRMWVNMINDSGGILTDSDEPGLLGRDVEITILDDQSTPSRAVNLYQRLINQEGVDLLMGPYSSAVTNAVIPIIEQSQIPAVSAMGSDTSVYTERDVSYVVQAIAPSPTYVQGAIDLAVENGAETLAAVYEDTAFPTSVVEGHVPYAEEQGLEVVYTDAYPADINDYTPIMREVQSADPDIVIGGGYTPDAIGLTQAARSIGFSTGMFSWVVGGMAPSFYESVGEGVRAVTGDHWWTPNLNVPHNEGMVEAINQYHGDEYESLAEGVDYHFPGAAASAMVLEQAVRNVGELDHAAIAEELHSLEMGVPWGNGKYAVNDQGVQTAHRPALGQWQQAEEGDGLVREAVYPSDTATADAVYPHPGWN